MKLTSRGVIILPIVLLGLSAAILYQVHHLEKMMLGADEDQEGSEVVPLAQVRNVLREQQEQHKHDMICIKAKLECETRENKDFPCIAAYGDKLVGDLLIENPKKCED